MLPGRVVVQCFCGDILHGPVGHGGPWIAAFCRHRLLPLQAMQPHTIGIENVPDVDDIDLVAIGEGGEISLQDVFGRIVVEARMVSPLARASAPSWRDRGVTA